MRHAVAQRLGYDPFFPWGEDGGERAFVTGAVFRMLYTGLYCRAWCHHHHPGREPLYDVVTRAWRIDSLPEVKGGHPHNDSVAYEAWTILRPRNDRLGLVGCVKPQERSRELRKGRVVIHGWGGALPVTLADGTWVFLPCFVHGRRRCVLGLSTPEDRADWRPGRVHARAPHMKHALFLFVLALTFVACRRSDPPPTTADATAKNAADENPWKAACASYGAWAERCKDDIRDEASSFERDFPTDPARCEESRSCMETLYRPEALDAFARCRVATSECTMCRIGEGMELSADSKSEIARVTEACRKAQTECEYVDCDMLEKSDTQALSTSQWQRLEKCMAGKNCAKMTNCVAGRYLEVRFDAVNCFGGKPVNTAEEENESPFDMQLSLANGQGEISLKELESVPVVAIYVLTLPCPTCPAVLAKMKALAQKNKKRMAALAIVEDASRPQAAAFAKKHKVTFPVAVDLSGSAKRTIRGGRPVLFLARKDWRMVLAIKDAKNADKYIRNALDRAATQ